MKKFKIILDPVGTGRVEIDGKDVSNQVSALTVVAGTREATEVVLQCRGEVDIEGEGVILVARPGALAEAIQKLDPKKIDEEALNRGGWGSKRSHTENVMDVIVEKLNALES